MTKIIITENSVRIHRNPVLVATNVIVLADKGDVWSAVDYDNSWYKIIVKDATGHLIPGYIHKSVSKEYAEDVPGKPLDYVPWRSQEDNDASSRANDCGEACVAMLVQYATGKYIPVDTLKVNNPTGLSTGGDLVGLLTKNSAPASWRFMSSLEEYPKPNSIVLVWYGAFDRRNVYHTSFKGWHWMVYLGQYTVNNQEWSVLHDPYVPPTSFSGRNHLYDPNEFKAAFIPYPGDSGRTVVELT